MGFESILTRFRKGLKRRTGPQGGEGAFDIGKQKFAFENEAKKKPQTNISVDVSQNAKTTGTT